MCLHSISAQSPSAFKKEIKIELNEILSYWEKNSVDVEKGGFYGAVDVNNVAKAQADKALILNKPNSLDFFSCLSDGPKTRV